MEKYSFFFVFCFLQNPKKKTKFYFFSKKVCFKHVNKIQINPTCLNKMVMVCRLWVALWLKLVKNQSFSKYFLYRLKIQNFGKLFFGLYLWYTKTKIRPKRSLEIILTNDDMAYWPTSQCFVFLSWSSPIVAVTRPYNTPNGTLLPRSLPRMMWRTGDAWIKIRDFGVITIVPSIFCLHVSLFYEWKIGKLKSARQIICIINHIEC